jgi:predicted O-methyltransferase YrrM
MTNGAPPNRQAVARLRRVIVTDAVERHLVESRTPPDDLLLEMEAHGARDRVPILPPESGAFLHTLVAATGARRVVEVGTAIGYSTLLIARALPDGGVVVSFEIDEERHQAAHGYLERAGAIERTDLRLQDAGAGLAELEPGSVDLAFIDGLKGDYAAHLELALKALRHGGTVVVDNTLLSGSVAEGRAIGHWTQGSVDEMRRFNQRVLTDPGLDAALVPIGDGMLIAVTR